jgi:hypothetical protein
MLKITARFKYEGKFVNVFKLYIINLYMVGGVKVGPGSSVGIATDYGLNDPGIESRLGCEFSHTSRPALRTTQPPVQWVPGLSRG